VLERVRTMLTNIGVDVNVLDNETAWLSVQSARRALRALSDSLGPDALQHRGEWAAHPEALGTQVRMLRSAKQTVDAYRYMAANYKELTRVGTWEIALDGEGGAEGHAGASGATGAKEKTDGTGKQVIKLVHLRCDAGNGRQASSYPGGAQQTSGYPGSAYPGSAHQGNTNGHRAPYDPKDDYRRLTHRD